MSYQLEVSAFYIRISKVLLGFLKSEWSTTRESKCVRWSICTVLLGHVVPKPTHTMDESTLYKGRISIRGYDLIKVGKKETRAHRHGHFSLLVAGRAQTVQGGGSQLHSWAVPPQKLLLLFISPGKSLAVSGMSASCWHQRCHQHKALIVTEPLQTCSHTRGLKHHVWQGTEHSRGFWLADWEQVKCPGSPWHATGCHATNTKQKQHKKNDNMGENPSSPPSLSCCLWPHAQGARLSL